MGTESAIPRIAIIGSDDRVRRLLATLGEGVTCIELPYDMDLLLDPIAPQPVAIFCMKPPADVSIFEMAQVFRASNKDVDLFFVGDLQEGYQKKVMIKNGFQDAFLLPFDAELLQDCLNEIVQRATAGKLLYRAVKLIDVEPGSVLPFDTFLYLPVNDRYLKISKEGHSISPEQVDRLKKHQFNTIHLQADKLPAFYEYTAARLKALGAEPRLSETQRAEKLRSAVRELISGIFQGDAASAGDGKQALEDCQKIVASYIKGSQSEKWYQRISEMTGDAGSTYSHAVKVSTYAALFSMALSAGKPDEVALAGLLHDIGLAKVSQSVLDKPEASRSQSEREQYYQHPLESIRILQARKFVLAPQVQRAILQHHERFAGRGYPEGLVGTGICVEARLIAIADHFDELTSIKPGARTPNPLEALRILKDENLSDPLRAALDPHLLKQILSLFPMGGFGMSRYENAVKAAG